MNETFVNIPTLDELISDPQKAATLPPAVAQRILIELASIQVILVQRALMGAGTHAARPPERFLTVEEVAAQFGVSVQWLYRHKKQLPHSQPSRKVLVFPEDKLRRWFTGRTTG